MAGRRPTPHVDNSMNTADASFVPEFISADAATQHVKALFHGDPGTGKTRGAGTFPKPIIIALDPGHSVLRQLPNAADIKILPIRDKVNADGSLDRGVLTQVWDVFKWLQAGDHDRETVVIDSATELHKSVLDAVMRRPRQRESPTIPTTDDYIEVAAKMKTLIRYFRDLPMHVVWTAHSKETKDKGGAVIGIKPDLSDKIANELAGASDVVLYCRPIEQQTAEGKSVTWYTGQTQPLNNVVAKDRSDRLRKPTCILGYEAIAEAFELAPPVTAETAKVAPAAARRKRPAPAAPDVAPVAAPDVAPTPAPDELPITAPATPTAACPRCEGDGWVNDGDTCPDCGGSGLDG